MAALAIWVGVIGAAAAQDQVITASMPAAWPPHYIAEPGQPPTGFAVEILDAVAAKSGYRVEYRITRTMREAYDMAAAGEVDVMPNVGIVAERKDVFAFTDPVETFVVSIFVRADTHDIGGAPDLTGRRVAVVKRNMGVNLMAKRPDVRAVEYDDLRTALFELVAGRVDAMVYPAPVLQDMAQQVGIDNRIKVVGEPLLEVKRAIAVHPSRGEIHARLADAVRDFVDTPEYQEIYVRWFGRPAEYWTAKRVLTWAGGAILVMFALFAAWHYRTIVRLNRTLEDRVEQRTKALRSAEEELRRKERLAALGELTGTMAHELRNPLGAIVTSFAVIRAKLRDGNEDAARSLERAERNIDRCTGIIDDLLEYAQVKSANRTASDLDDLIRDILDDYSLPVGVSVEIDLGLGGKLVAIDEEQIRRMLLNFLDNACDAIAERDPMAHGGGRIRISTRPGETGAEISVSDNGAGIPGEVLARIFDPLFSTKPFGVGLGLSNAQNIVAQHGGRLVAENNPGGGARLSVWLPAGEPSQSEAA